MKTIPKRFRAPPHSDDIQDVYNVLSAFLDKHHDVLFDTNAGGSIDEALIEIKAQIERAGNRQLETAEKLTLWSANDEERI